MTSNDEFNDNKYEINNVKIWKRSKGVNFE